MAYYDEYNDKIDPNDQGIDAFFTSLASGETEPQLEPQPEPGPEPAPSGPEPVLSPDVPTGTTSSPGGSPEPGGTDGSPELGGTDAGSIDAGNMTPTRPRSPQPVSAASADTPTAFSTMPSDPTMGYGSPAAQTVALRTPYISTPFQYGQASRVKSPFGLGGGGPQTYGDTGGGPRLFRRQRALLESPGGEVTGVDRDRDSGQLSALIKSILQQQRS